jgi:hypothetical protein
MPLSQVLYVLEAMSVLAMPAPAIKIRLAQGHGLLPLQGVLR